MAIRTWTICDVARDEYLESLVVTPGKVGGRARGYRVSKRRLRGGLRDGVDLVEIDNGLLQVAIIPTRGMGIWEIRVGEFRIGWQAPVQGPVHPQFVPLFEPSGLGWLDGFDELLVRCGLESNGAPEFDEQGRLRYPLHGKIANIPAHRVELCVDGDAGRIQLSGAVDEVRLFFNKLRLTTLYQTEVGSRVLQVTDTVTNLSAEPGELELLYHINFGLPLLEPGSRVVVPVRRLAPRDAVAAAVVDSWDSYPPETPGIKEAVYFMQLHSDPTGQTVAVLHNSAGSRGVAIRFNVAELPYFTLWKNPQAAVDGYVTGLEPGVNFPNRRSFEKEKGRVVTLQPGQVRTFNLSIEVLLDEGQVRQAVAQVANLAAQGLAEICRDPLPEWSMI
ncbi:MAG: aldose 1-epimerase family protein [Thermoguttaceae bacterium]|nr:aldose 1-epimerase family protein [Thermoguttaceae bacterium]MDW8079244.1 aldose 1-epimerase family protein [Thermoguttaceae bacterium]